jgi:hypothetical protein
LQTFLQGWRARLPGKAAGQGCRARLPGKAAGQGLPGKAGRQGYRARLPGKGYRARLPGKSILPYCKSESELKPSPQQDVFSFTEIQLTAATEYKTCDFTAKTSQFSKTLSRFI